MFQFLSQHAQLIGGFIEVAVFLVVLYLAVKGFSVKLEAFETRALEHWEVQEKGLKLFEEKVMAHFEDTQPHKACPAHAQRLEDTLSRLDRIQLDIRDMRGDFARVENWIVQILGIRAAKEEKR